VSAAAGPVIVAGGGIGGLAAALALAQRGFRVKVLEQAAELGEIGAGVQLAPNAFAAFDALGVGAQARGRAVYTERMVMMDAVDESVVADVPTGEAFRGRFGNPYAVIHRADVHLSLLEGVRARARRRGADVDPRRPLRGRGRSCGGGVQRGAAPVGADGVTSAVRAQTVGDEVRVSGHVVYRAVVDVVDFPGGAALERTSGQGRPNCHLVHYPLRGGDQYNVVVTFHSRQPET
jgi:2-polyprenyl-6-methoxyphenol hydroxylase-like FAD-dependent oxidoreductase